MWECPCVACVGLIFVVQGLFGCLLPLSSVYAGLYHLGRRGDWCCGDQSLHWILSGTSSLLCGYHCPVLKKPMEKQILLFLIH